MYAVTTLLSPLVQSASRHLVCLHHHQLLACNIADKPALTLISLQAAAKDILLGCWDRGTLWLSAYWISIFQVFLLTYVLSVQCSHIYNASAARTLACMRPRTKLSC